MFHQRTNIDYFFAITKKKNIMTKRYIGICDLWGQLVRLISIYECFFDNFSKNTNSDCYLELNGFVVIQITRIRYLLV